MSLNLKILSFLVLLPLPLLAETTFEVVDFREDPIVKGKVYVLRVRTLGEGVRRVAAQGIFMIHSGLS